ncbi:hypothetical protein [Pyrinomonas sp.]
MNESDEISFALGPRFGAAMMVEAKADASASCVRSRAIFPETEMLGKGV